MRIAAAAVALALTACLTGCIGGAPTPSPEPSASPTAAPTTTPTPPPAPSPAFTLPDCETLVPIADARAVFGDATVFFGDQPPSEAALGFQVPEVREAIETVDPARHCLWGIPNSDGSFKVSAASITDADRTALETALTSAGYTSATLGTVTGLEFEGESEVSSIAETHLFTGELWIAVHGTTLSLTGVIAATVLDSMRTANPTLGL